MKVYNDIREMLCDELEEIAKKNELTTNSLEVIYKSVDIIKDLSVIEAMEEEYGHHDGYSNGYYDRYPYYMYDDMSSYARGRKRDSMGRYSRDYEHEGYSRDSMKDELRAMMDKAKTDKEREAIRMALDSMNK